MENNFYKLITTPMKIIFKEKEEKSERTKELIIANKELVFQRNENAIMAAELLSANKKLIIANKELVFQRDKKAVMVGGLLSANKKLIIANKAQGEFLVNISHELKTPLNVIYSIAQLLEMYCNCDSLNDKKNSIIKYIDSMKLNSHRLSKLINNIVDLSKIEAGFFKLNLSNNNIVKVVEEIVMSVTSLTDIKGLNIIFDTNIEEKIIACDTDKIERIVLNLISNAIKFSNEGDEIFVQIKDKSEFVQISVKDNGIGIKNEDLGLIFDRFKQVDKSLSRNKEGSGVGLSLVKSIVELHGGSICAESEFGKGSKFTVLLPSRKVLQENKIYSSEMRNIDEFIRVELSDIY